MQSRSTRCLLRWKGFCREQIEGKGLVYRQIVEPDLPLIHVDRLRIRQVLLNLLINALRFTAEGGITVEAEQGPDCVRFTVTDSGGGISASDLPHIFEPFHTITQQLDGGWPEGKGLGLPISKKYVEMHGGTMAAESEPGEGATIWFTVPCQPQMATARRPHTSGFFQSNGKPPAPERLLIMAFEDPATQALLERRLDGFRVLSAVDRAEAERMAADLHPVAIVVESCESGLETAETGRGGPPVLPLPWRSSRQIAEALGVDGVLIKPIAGDLLLKMLDKWAFAPSQVLIADEDPETVRLLRRMLRGRVAADAFLDAYSGAEAVQRALDETPDLILLDVNLCDESGEPVFQRLAGATNDVRVLLTTDEHWVESGLDRPDALRLYRGGGFTLSPLISHMRTLLFDLAAH